MREFNQKMIALSMISVLKSQLGIMNLVLIFIQVTDAFKILGRCEHLLFH